MSNYTEDQLREVALLAENLDSSGARDAARVVRHHLSIMRGHNSTSSAAAVILWAARLVADAARDRATITDKIVNNVATMKVCHKASVEGGHAVAELVDTVLVAAVMMLAPMTFQHRRYPVVGERVMIVDDLDQLPDALTMPDEDDACPFGKVLEVSVPRGCARVSFHGLDRDACWFDFRDIVGIRRFGAGE